jgi:hypothetical protein
MRIVVISDLLGRPSSSSPESGRLWEVLSPTAGEVSTDALASFDLIVVLAAIDDANRAIEISGVIDHLLHQGKTVVLLYRVRLDGGLATIFERLVRMRYGHVQSEGPATAVSPAWETFFRSYGTSATHFGTEQVANARSVAVVQHGLEPSRPAAFAIPHGTGTIYVIPFHVADIGESHSRLLADLCHAVTADVGEGLSPEYLAELRLPGEDELLDEVARLEHDLATQRAEAETLYKYRLLLGPLSGDPLEELVRDVLGVVLAKTSYRVEDLVEQFREDFWICGPEGDFALAEVKGISSGVGRSEINQVDNHREALGHDTAELPGLLVVNAYRQDADLTRRIEQDIHPQIVAALRRQNVTLLRTADLYYLLAKQMRDGNAGAILIEALKRGGGWLEATNDHSRLHPLEV